MVIWLLVAWASAQDSTAAPQPVAEVPLLPAEPSASESTGNGISVAVTNDFEFRYWVKDERVPGFPDRAVFNYMEQVNRTNISIGKGPWSAWAQIDQVALFANRYRLDGELVNERELVGPSAYSPLPNFLYVNPEKLSATYDGGNVKVTLGDFYATFGNGVALSVNRNPQVDIDSSIQGARVTYSSSLWDVVALVGQLNRQQVFQDNPNMDISGDRRHLVGGVRVDRYGLGPASIGAHAVMVDYVQDTGFGPSFSQLSGPDGIVAGASTELYGVGGIDWLAEADAFYYGAGDLITPNGSDWGYAAYASATAYVGPTTWQFEGKRYLNTETLNGPLGDEQYELAIAPTLEYDLAITEDSSGAINSDDIAGGRLRVDWAADPGKLTPYASLAVFRDWDTGPLHFNTVPETIVHPFVGVEWFPGETAAIVNVGYRTDIRDGDESGADRQLYTDLDIKFPIGNHIHLDVAGQGEWYRWGVNPLQQEDYVEFTSSISALHGSDWAIIWYTDFTNNPLVSSKGNLTEVLYGALEVQVKPSDALTLKLFGGSQKEGLRCAGGQCRVLPGFSGIRAAAVGSF